MRLRELTLWAFGGAEKVEESAQNYTVGAAHWCVESLDHCFKGYFWQRSRISLSRCSCLSQRMSRLIWSLRPYTHVGNADHLINIICILIRNTCSHIFTKCHGRQAGNPNPNFIWWRSCVASTIKRKQTKWQQVVSSVYASGHLGWIKKETVWYHGVTIVINNYLCLKVYFLMKIHPLRGTIENMRTNISRLVENDCRLAIAILKIPSTSVLIYIFFRIMWCYVMHPAVKEYLNI